MRCFRPFVVLLLLLPLSGCFGYRLIRLEEIEVPNYDPRPVAIPEECDVLIERAASGGMGELTEAQARMVLFCQQQHLIRAQEEEAIARKIEAHAETADFALRVVTVVAGAIVSIIAWAL